MKKSFIAITLLVALLLSSCSAPVAEPSPEPTALEVVATVEVTPTPEPIVTPEPTPSPSPTPLPDLYVVNGNEYHLADYDRFNSFASDNGLGGSLIYDVGVISKVEFQETEDYSVVQLFFTREDDKQWVVMFAPASIFKVDFFEANIGKPCKIFFQYDGYSEILAMPCSFDISKLALRFDENKTITYNYENFIAVDLPSKIEKIGLMSFNILDSVSLLNTNTDSDSSKYAVLATTLNGRIVLSMNCIALNSSEVDLFSASQRDELVMSELSGFGVSDYDSIKEVKIDGQRGIMFTFTSGEKLSYYKVVMVNFVYRNKLYGFGVASPEEQVVLRDKFVDDIIESAKLEVVKENWYGASTYKVGTDIPAGEYYIEATDSWGAYMAVCSSSDSNKILENDNFSTHHFITVSDGQYFEISRGRALSVDELDIVFDSSDLEEGMYRVGIDIPAGEYKLIANSDWGGYYCVYNNSTPNRKIQSNANFDGNKYVTVREGQYLLLDRCDGSLVK